jgi:hypothetical protein
MYSTMSLCPLASARSLVEDEGAIRERQEQRRQRDKVQRNSEDGEREACCNQRQRRSACAYLSVLLSRQPSPTWA